MKEKTKNTGLIATTIMLAIFAMASGACFFFGGMSFSSDHPTRGFFLLIAGAFFCFIALFILWVRSELKEEYGEEAKKEGKDRWHEDCAVTDGAEHRPDVKRMVDDELHSHPQDVH